MEIFQILMPIFTEYGYIAVFIMLLLCGFGIPVPEDVTLVTGGVIVGLGYAEIETMVLVGMLGVLIGDGIMFGMGRLFGKKIQKKYWFCRIMPPTRFESAQASFKKYGKSVMFVARFLPGLRTPIFFSAGMSRTVSFGTWLLMDGFAAIISVPLWIYLGSLGAQNWDWMFSMIHRFQYTILIILSIVGMYVLFKFYKKHKEKIKLQ